MKKYCLLPFSFLISISICGQVSDKIPGIYSLTSVMETASAFKLNKDSTFEFYFSYGALDRYGSGKWSIVNKLIVLNSKPYPGKDFKLTDSSLTKNSFITIQIKDKNPHLYRFVYCLSKGETGDSLLNANDSGIIILPRNHDTINLW